MASREGQSNPYTSGDAGGDHNEDFGNEYGSPLPTQEELREMEHRRLVGEATNLMLNFAKDPKLAKYMSETAFQDVQAQWKATTTSPPKPYSKKEYSEKELEEEIDARLARILGAQKQGKKHDRKRKKSIDFPGYLGSQSTFDKAKKHKRRAIVPSSSSSSDSSSESSEEERRSKKRSKRHRHGKGKRKTSKSKSCRVDDSSTEDSSTDSSARLFPYVRTDRIRTVRDIMPRRPNPLWAEHTNVLRVVNTSGQAGSGTRTWVCKYCGEQMTSTITRVLKHLTGIGTTGHCGGCEAVPPALRDALILEHFPPGSTASSQSGGARAAAIAAEDALQDALLGDIGGSASAVPSFAGTSRKRARVSQAEDEGASASAASTAGLGSDSTTESSSTLGGNVGSKSKVVFQMSTLQIFNEEELDYLLCGCKEVWTADSLVEHIKFDHGYTASSPPIRHLLEIMGEFTPEQQHAFLRFVTGAPRLPSGGLAALNPKLTIVRKHPTGVSGTTAVLGSTPPGTSALGTPLADGDLPSVMTCANYLKLPPYSCKEVMRERLLFAISEGQGSFDLS
ncbi:hypothetical protein L7F22_034815 [Adiantum nelumboides]|nr:hypothetical protein [Adiantum nelumboides]